MMLGITLLILHNKTNPLISSGLNIGRLSRSEDRVHQLVWVSAPGLSVGRAGPRSIGGPPEQRSGGSPHQERQGAPRSAVSSAPNGTAIPDWKIGSGPRLVGLHRAGAQAKRSRVFPPTSRCGTRSGACGWRREGSLAALQEVMGHASIVTTQRYARLGGSHVRSEAGRLEGRLSPKLSPARNPSRLQRMS